MMSNTKAELRKARCYYQKVAKASEEEVDSLECDVANFLSKNHNASETKKAKDTTKRIYAEVKAASLSLGRVEKAYPQFKREGSRYNKRFEKVLEKITAIQNDLKEDLDERVKERNQLIASASFILGLPISSYIAAKNGLFSEFLSANEVAFTALCVSSGLVFNKEIIECFHSAQRQLCEISNGAKEYPRLSRAIDYCKFGKEALLRKGAQAEDVPQLPGAAVEVIEDQKLQK